MSTVQKQKQLKVQKQMEEQRKAGKESSKTGKGKPTDPTSGISFRHATVAEALGQGPDQSESELGSDAQQGGGAGGAGGRRESSELKKNVGGPTNPATEEEGEEEQGDGEEQMDDPEQLRSQLRVWQQQMEQMQLKIEWLEAGKSNKSPVSRQLFSSIPTSGGFAYTSVPASGGGASVYNPPVTTGTIRSGSPVEEKLPNLNPMAMFNGDMDADRLDGWIRTLMTQTSYYDAAGRMVTEKSKVAFASAHLEGAASDWWYSTAHKTVVTLKQFIDAVNGRFKSSLDADVAADKLHSLKQGGSQPVAQYVGVVQQLLIRIPTMDMESRVRSFVRGLIPQLAQKLRELRPKTVEEAYEHAIRIEGSFGTTAGKGSGKAQSLNNVEGEQEQGTGETSSNTGTTITLAAIQRMVDQRLREHQTLSRAKALACNSF